MRSATAESVPSLGEISVVNPATEEVVGSIPDSPPELVAAAVARARAAQPAWAALGFRARAAVLSRFHDLVLDHADRIQDTIQKETGKARRDALGEVVTVAGTARYYVVHGGHHLRDRRRRSTLPLLTSARVVYKPLGVVGLITPWNFPFLLPIADSIGALLAGNAVVVKPSELTPFAAEVGRELLLEAGLAPDLFQLVHGLGPSAGQELIRHVDFIGFTGSTAVGRKVMMAAAERLLPFSLELGGKNPLIVLADAPLDDAVSGLLSGSFANGGQTCIAIERAFVERPIYDRFVEQAVRRTEALQVGWSLGFDKDLGSLISPAHRDKVAGHVDDAVAKGATVLAGGKAPEGKGAFYRPTLLTGVTPEMRLAREETFGPVVAIEPFDSVDEAITKANDTVYGLNASVWGGDRGRSLEVARRLESGSAGVNSTLLIYNAFDTPMGGVKESGIGRRHGEHGILRYTQEQSLVASVATAGGYEAILTAMTNPRRARGLLGLFRLWRRIPGFR